jgi:hypothetical protein
VRSPATKGDETDVNRRKQGNYGSSEHILIRNLCSKNASSDRFAGDSSNRILLLRRLLVKAEGQVQSQGIKYRSKVDAWLAAADHAHLTPGYTELFA